MAAKPGRIDYVFNDKGQIAFHVYDAVVNHWDIYYLYAWRSL